ncbi:hypothetical protein GGQ99_000963 [Aminobacter niigataensis]|uniref:Tip attachment protein J domain-containing protein n=1 Tax=Aminobacter niigataensis TaxID=83265 RepID=A0ABR6KXI2_9HYPH|nr:hypothetical protein [Aminobacter niigataensis]MBB4649241.1 hypothetical protein [Aminobacter niigataensis]
MVARPASPFRSANAAELSSDAKGRVDIKQYYSGGLAYKNIEPVPQSGFRQMGGTWRKGVWRKPLVDRAITSPSTAAGPHTGTQTIWTGTVAGTVAAVFVQNLAINAGTATFEMQAEIGGVWTKIAGPFAVASGTPETRLGAFAPGAQKVATGLRIRATFSTSATVTIGVVSAFFEDGTGHVPRFAELTTDDMDAFVCVVTAGIADFFTDAGYVGSARVAAVTAAMLPDLDFYTEGRTIGLFHGDLESERLFLATVGQLQDWRRSLWPYDILPTADLGGVYAKTDDKWEIYLNWLAPTDQVYIVVTVNGEQTPGVPVPDALGDPVNLSSGTPDWALFATNLQTALRALPTLNNGVTVTQANAASRSRRLVITFGGSLSGEEYQVSSLISNTSEASALATHSQIGETDYEAMFSNTRGWPGTISLVQDRMGYARAPAVTGAMAFSRTGEYFDLNIEAVSDAAARLDKLRSQTSETVLHLKESKYTLAFTDRGAYFANNRTIERNTPLNFVLASEIGAQPNCKPFDLEGEVHYVAINPQGLVNYAAGGNQLLSIIYDDVSTSYTATPVSLLASHLVTKLTRSARQRSRSDLDASKGWLMRSDGRLVAGQFIRNQEITGFCEWIAASNGLVREIIIDGKNRLWVAVERGAERSIELYDDLIYLHDAVAVVPDLAGVVTALPYVDGTVLYAVADGFDIGPFTVSGGSINLQDAYASAIVGRWQPPRFESMPQVYVTPGDDVIMRPGRIHTAHVNIVDTTSIAIGANGQPPQDVPLLQTSDPVDAPPPPKTKLITVGGLMGFMESPTLVITQTRPGKFRVRDYAIGAKL